MSIILITGGAGFIGQRVARALLGCGFHVRILDNFSEQVHSSASMPPDITKHVEIFNADIRDRDAVRTALLGVSKVLHLAAETGTGQSMYEIYKYFDVNVQGTATLIDLIQNGACGSSLQSITVASSRAVYGEGAYKCVEHEMVFPHARSSEFLSCGFFEPVCPICGRAVSLVATPESAPFMPMSMYGLTKQVQEQAVLLFARTFGINAFSLRFQNVYGPGQSLKNPYTGILAVFFNLARQNIDIDIYEDGNESRDFIYIDDVVDATVGTINYSNKFVGALNVGSGNGTSVLNVAKSILSSVDTKSLINISGKFRIGDIRHNIADISKINKILSFTPKVSFDEGVREFLLWALNQEPHDKNSYQNSVNELLAHGLMGTIKV